MTYARSMRPTRSHARLVALAACASLAVSIDAFASHARAGFPEVTALVPSGVHTCPAGMAFVRGGSFAMYGGDDRGLSAHAGEPTTQIVSVESFCMDLTEVTQRAYDACASEGRCAIAYDSCYEKAKGSFKTNCPCNTGLADRRDHPANCIDVAQSEAYCAAHGARLPTEMEWQWAARGGTRAFTYPWGNQPPANGSSLQDDTLLCWSGSYSRQTTCPVGQYPAGNGPLGLADLAGNVYEWTSSRAPDASSSWNVYRGGAAFTMEIEYLDVAERNWDEREGRWSGVGFRCAR